MVSYVLNQIWEKFYLTVVWKLCIVLKAMIVTEIFIY